MITRRNVLGGLALTAVPATSVAAISLSFERKVEVLPPSLEERLAKMEPIRRAELLACMLAKAMKEVNSGPWDVTFDTRATGTEFVIIKMRV